MMYVIDYLAGRYVPSQKNDASVAEYRLLCSGEIYDGTVLTADWRKSDAMPVFRLIHPPIFRIIHPPVPRPA